MKTCLSILMAVLLLVTENASAADPIVIAPLFEYPSAPEELTTLDARSDYLMEHFWDKMDFRAKNVSQHALDDAFGVYVAAMQFADRDKVHKSIDELLKKLKKNPGLLTQFTKAAEDNLYGDRADIHSDEAYLPFLKAVTTNKKIPALRKNRWALQLKQLENSMVGSKIPNFEIEERSGAKGIFIPRHKMTIIEFGDPSCEDCRFSRLALETNVPLRYLVDNEKAAIAFIVISPEEDWKEEVKDYPSRWLVASSEGIDDILDIRRTPTFYIVDSEGKIITKNISAEKAAAIVTEALNKNDSINP